MKVYIICVFLLMSTSIHAQKPQSVKDRNGKTYLLHEVQKGEGALAIARKYGLTLNALAQANPIDLNRLTQGQVLRIPLADSVEADSNKFVIQKDTSSVTLAHANAQEIKQSQTYNIQYTVKPGDNLNKIAAAYNVSVSDIQKWNRLSQAQIIPGQVLKINPFYASIPYKAWNKPLPDSNIQTHSHSITLPLTAVYVTVKWIEGSQAIYSKRSQGGIVAIEPLYQPGAKRVLTTVTYAEDTPENILLIGTDYAKAMMLDTDITDYILYLIE